MQIRVLILILLVNLPLILAAQQIDWWKRYGGNGDDAAVKSFLMPNDDLMVIGHTNSFDGDVADSLGNYDAWIIRVDQDSNLVWQANYGGSSADRVYDAVETTDGNYVIAGYSYSVDNNLPGSNGLADVWLFKIAGNGQLLWSQNYGGSMDEVEFPRIAASPDGGVVAASTSWSNDGDIGVNFGSRDIWMFKVDVNGLLEWSEVIGGTDHDAVNAVINYGNDFLVLANTRSDDANAIFSDNNGWIDGLILQIDVQGNLINHKIYGGSGGDLFNNGLVLSTGDIVLVG